MSRDSADYGVQDSLSLDTGGISKRSLQVQEAQNRLLNQWADFTDSDMNSLRRFYNRKQPKCRWWARLKANLTVRLVWWVLVGSVALAFMAYVLLVLAFAIKEVL